MYFFFLNLTNTIFNTVISIAVKDAGNGYFHTQGNFNFSYLGRIFWPKYG